MTTSPGTPWSTGSNTGSDEGPDKGSDNGSRSSASTMVAGSVEDVLAMVPVVLGFTPTESVAMLTFGAARPFHARVDLPASRGEISEVVEQLLAPARRHGVRETLFVLYATHERLAAPLGRALTRSFEQAGIGVLEVLRADGSRWYPAIGSRRGVPPWGVPYDVSAHRFLAQAVVDGRVTLGSREELRDTLAGDAELIGGVVAALAGLTGDPPPYSMEAAWAEELVERHVRDGTRPDDRAVARLVRGMLDVRVRDAAWGPLTRATAREHVRFWADVVRRTPAPLVPAPATLLAFAAWQAGQGALAWCALDRCAEVDEDYSLAGLVAHALAHAIPPDAWVDGAPDS